MVCDPDNPNSLCYGANRKIESKKPKIKDAGLCDPNNRNSLCYGANRKTESKKPEIDIDIEPAKETGDAACDMNGPIDCNGKHREDYIYKVYLSPPNDKNSSTNPTSLLGPIRMQIGYRFAGTAISRNEYVRRAASIPKKVNKAIKEMRTSMKHAAETSVQSRRLLEKAARQNLPAEEASLSATRNIKKYDDPLGHKNLVEARKSRSGKPQKSLSNVIKSSGKTSRAFTGFSRILGGLGIIGTIFQSIEWGQTYTKSGYVNIGGVIILTDPKKYYGTEGVNSWYYNNPRNQIY